ncbi:hypothetical protein ACFOWB_06655 [Chenggangzhangella methanolivorans]|uniref:hypothetical protein n=1 Tax=Chenggangzhangella methanolivorans TaxID=1437009 RepID=UPI00360B72ED
MVEEAGATLFNGKQPRDRLGGEEGAGNLKLVVSGAATMPRVALAPSTTLRVVPLPR